MLQGLKNKYPDSEEGIKRTVTSEVIHNRCSEVIKKKSPGLFRSPITKNEDYFYNKLQDNEFEEGKDETYFPELIEHDRQEDRASPVLDCVPHKLPDLSNKYRKFLKESSSDEFDNKKNPFELAEGTHEFDQKLYALKELEIDRNDNCDMYSNNVNRSRSMLNRFNQNYNTTDSKRNSNICVLPNTLTKKSKASKDDNSSASPIRLLNISGTTKKKVRFTKLVFFYLLISCREPKK